MAVRDALDFEGPGVVVTDDAPGNRTKATIAGGIPKGNAFPVAPGDGDPFIRTDLGDRMFIFKAGIGWDEIPRMGAVTVPAVRARHNAGQAIPGPGAPDYVVLFNTEDYDTDGIHDTAANTSQFTPRTPGRYAVKALLVLTGVNGSTAVIEARLRLTPASGGAPFNIARARKQFHTNGSAPTVEVATDYTLAAGDIVEVVVNHGDANPNNIQSLGQECPLFEMTWQGGPGQTVDERGVPACRAYIATDPTTQTLLSGVTTPIAFDAEVFDTDGMHDNAVDNTRFYAKAPGIYHVSGALIFAAPGTGSPPTGTQREVQVRKNGATVVDDVGLPPFGGTSWTTVPFSTDVQLAAGDYIEILGWQDSGGALALRGSNAKTHLAIHLVASGKTVTPYAKAYRAAALDAADGAWTLIPFDAEIADNDGIHDVGADQSRMVCRTAGVYAVAAAVELAPAAGGNRILSVLKNAAGAWSVGARVAESSVPAQGTLNPRLIAADFVELAVGDYVEAMVFQNSGGPLAIQVADPQQCNLTLVKVGSPSAPPIAVTGASGLGAQDLLQPGVLVGTDCALTVTDPTHVHIAPSPRLFVMSAGGVLVPTAPAATDITIPAIAANPRLDQIVIDTAGVVSRIAGAETAGANIVNRNGHGAVPAGSQLLHDLLIDGSGVVADANHVRDRRGWAKGAHYNYWANNLADYTTNSTSWIEIDSANLAARVEIQSGIFDVVLDGVLWADNADKQWLRVDVGGVGQLIDGGVQVDNWTDDKSSWNARRRISKRISGVPPGSYNVSVLWASTSGPTIHLARSAGYPLSFTVEEVVRQNARNGIA
jgi:hypothetical protein